MKKLNYLSLITLTALLGLSSCSNEDNASHDSEFKFIPDDAPASFNEHNGFYILNEGWFGHDLGSVNQIDKHNNVLYDIFDKVNPIPETKPGQEPEPQATLGLTSQFAGAYANYYFFISKMENSLVMTNKDFKVLDFHQDIMGQGRGFVGVSPEKIYVSTSKGITIVDLSTKDNMLVKGQIPEINSETGSMVYIHNLVYAVVKNQGLVVINTQNDQVLSKFDGNYTQVTLDRHGMVWASTENTLHQIDPNTPQELQQTIDISQAPLKAKWYAWTPGSLTASMQNDNIYWTSSDQVYKLNTQSLEFNSIYTLGQDKHGKDLEFIGAGLGINPLTGELILNIVRSGWGDNFAYNYVRFLDPNGNYKTDIFLKSGDRPDNINAEGGYYWFPSMTFFQDNNKPQILSNQIITHAEKTFEIELDKIVVDADTPITWATYQIENNNENLAKIAIENNKLMIQTSSTKGKSSFTLSIISNGYQTQKTIELWVR